MRTIAVYVPSVDEIFETDPIDPSYGFTDKRIVRFYYKGKPVNIWSLSDDETRVVILGDI